MALNKYRILEFLNIAVITCVVILSALMWKNPWIPGIAVIISITLGIYLRLKVKELAPDERANTIAEKALSFACGLFIIIAGIAGLTLVVIGMDRTDFLTPVGLTLCGSAFAVVILYAVATLYYNGKLSGKV